VVARPGTDVNTHIMDAPSGTGTRAQGNLKGFVDEADLERFEGMRKCFYHIPTSLDPGKPKPASEKPEDWTKFPNNAEFPVWAQAHVIGEKPNRRWLVFAYAPLADKKAVKIMIPDGETITLDVPQAGVYAVVEEGKGLVKTIPTTSIED
jgi:hypothetical protein